MQQSDLDAYVGKTISDLCDTSYVDKAHNHCAHFVSHVLNLQLGIVCGDLGKTAKTRGQGASIRCNEVYNRLTTRGPWDEKPEKADGLLVFVLSAKNVVKNIMGETPQKHVGIHFAGSVYHYGNSKDLVAKDSVDDFHKKFKGLYSGGDVSLYYGVLN